MTTAGDCDWRSTAVNVEVGNGPGTRISFHWRCQRCFHRCAHTDSYHIMNICSDESFPNLLTIHSLVVIKEEGRYFGRMQCKKGRKTRLVGCFCTRDCLFFSDILCLHQFDFRANADGLTVKRENGRVSTIALSPNHICLRFQQQPSTHSTPKQVVKYQCTA